jgi:pimeloyl-ACP methyl ester carboxylesterase
MIGAFYNPDGTVALLTSGQTIPANGLVTLDAEALGLPAGFEGSSVISADNPIDVVANIQQTSPLSLVSYTASPYGEMESLLPRILRNWNGWNTEIWVQNTGAATANISLSYIPKGGGNSHSAVDTIPPGAAHVYRQADIPELGASFSGWAQISADQSFALIVEEQNSTDGWAAAYGGDAFVTRMHVPTSSAHNPMAVYSIYFPRQQKDADGWSSIARVANPNAQDANIVATYLNQDGSIAANKNDTVPAGGSLVLDVMDNPNIPAGFDGALIISADQGLLGLSTWENPNLLNVDAYASSPIQSGGSTMVHFPRVVHAESDSVTTELSVQNAGSAPANVTLLFIDQAGVQTTSISGIGLQPGAASRTSTENVAALGTLWEGTVIAQSDEPVVGEAIQILSPTSPVQPPVILLPGLMGTNLWNLPADTPECANRPEDEIWLNILALLNPFVDNDELMGTLVLDSDGVTPANACDDIYPNGIIDRLQFVVTLQDSYYTFLNEMTAEGFDVHPFPYDWRLDLEGSAQELESFIADQFGDGPVILVGHSMGGLLARQYVLDPDRADQVDRVISVGTPYWGAPKLARHMRDGSVPNTLLDYLIGNEVTKQLIRNAPGVMQILPSAAYFDQVGWYYRTNLNTLNTYQETLDYFVSQNQNEDLLTAAQLFHDSIDDFRTDLTVPYHALITSHRYVASRFWEYPCLFGRCIVPIGYSTGDGTVTWASGNLSGNAGDWSGNAAVCTYTIDNLAEHGELLSDSRVYTDIVHILRDEATQNCTPSQVLAQHPERLRSPAPIHQLAVSGEVTVQIVDSYGNEAGITTDGFVTNEIPKAAYDLSSSGSFVVLPYTSTYTVTIGLESNTPIQVRMTEFQPSGAPDQFDPAQAAVFIDVPAEAGGQAILTFDPSVGISALELALDLDDDGTVDQVLSPDSILDPSQVEDYSLPVTSIQIEGSLDPLGGYTGPVTATLTATDIGAGVFKTEYSLDEGVTWENYQSPMVVDPSLVPVLYARSVDLAGNSEFPFAKRYLQPLQVYLPLLIR